MTERSTRHATFVIARDYAAAPAHRKQLRQSPCR